MSQFYHEKKIFSSQSFSHQSLEKTIFSECQFTHCDFTDANFSEAKFCFCIFENCNLSLVKFDHCRFQEAQFIDCKIIGAEFFKCDKTFLSVNFKNCLIQYCNFSDLNLKNSSFRGSKCKENHFTNTILIAADFTHVDLLGTIFHGCDLSKADFSHAQNYSIDPLSNKIKKASFTLPEALALLQNFDVIIS